MTKCKKGAHVLYNNRHCYITVVGNSLIGSDCCIVRTVKNNIPFIANKSDLIYPETNKEVKDVLIKYDD